MNRFSTGALTAEQHKQQDARYTEGHAYDFVIIGTGMSALSAGALLAHAGYRVCMLEAHDVPGGYAHTFAMEGFHFCAHVHYIWGCAPRQAIHQFLTHLGLEKEITFEALDPEGYDRVALPDGKKVMIPYGFDKLVDNIDAAYPGQRQNLEKFIATLTAIGDEMHKLPSTIRWWQYLTSGYKFLTLLRYKNKTLQDLFDECSLSKEVQAVLCADAGDYGSPPEELSVLAYTGLFAGYNEGAYYPTKHFKHLIDRLAQFITDQPGCHIYYETEVNAIKVEGDHVAEVTTSNGKVFRGNKYICNMDPQKAATMIGRDKFPSSYLPALSYQYSSSSFIIYLGLEGIDIRDYGFGTFNTWHLENWDMNKMWKEQFSDNFKMPWFFMSTPSLRTADTSCAPPGCQIMEIATMVSYEQFHQLKENTPHEYREKKRFLRDRLLDLIELRYIPDLRKHIKVMVSGTPTTNVDFCWAPYGNCYGSVMSPNNVSTDRLKAQTPWKNLFWCNASSGYAGIHGTTLTGANLFTSLTDEQVIDHTARPTTEEAIRYASSHAYGAARPQTAKVYS